MHAAYRYEGHAVVCVKSVLSAWCTKCVALCMQELFIHIYHGHRQSFLVTHVMAATN